MEDLNFTVLWRSYGDLEVTKVWGDPPASRGLRKHLFLCWHCTLGHANLCPGHGLGPANQSRRRRSGMNSHLVCWRIPVTWLPLALAPGAICGAPSWLPSSGLSHCCPLQKSIPARIKSEVSGPWGDQTKLPSCEGLKKHNYFSTIQEMHKGEKLFLLVHKWILHNSV